MTDARHPILIAECCQNHNGDRTLLSEMIHAAAGSGADFVKIQAIRSRELTRRERFEAGETSADGTVRAIRRPYEQVFARLSKLDLSLDDEAWFVDECHAAGVAAMTTAFTRAGAREVKDMGYDAIKIASYDCPSFPLLRDVRRWWSTVFVSTGACFEDEIARASAILAGTEFSLLHCVTIYPTPMAELHLRRMSWLRSFTPRVGFSDHTLVARDGILASRLAMALGASCIERHFTILDDDKTKDGPVSIRPADLAALRADANLPRVERMAAIRDDYPGWREALGSAHRPLSPAELLNRDYYRGRFASMQDGRPIFNWEDARLGGVDEATVNGG